MNRLGEQLANAYRGREHEQEQRQDFAQRILAMNANTKSLNEIEYGEGPNEPGELSERRIIDRGNGAAGRMAELARTTKRNGEEGSEGDRNRDRRANGGVPGERLVRAPGAGNGSSSEEVGKGGKGGSRRGRTRRGR